MTMEDNDVVTLSVDAATGNLRMIEGRLYWTSIPEARTIWMSDMRHYYRARRWLYPAQYISVPACILGEIDVCGISAFSIMPAP